MEKENYVLSVFNLVLNHHEHLVLDKVSLSLKKGEFVYLVGKTGSGKSSFLRCLYKDLDFNSGKINLSGFDLSSMSRKDIPQLRRKIGIIFQDFELLYDRTVSDNLLFVLKAIGWKSKSKILARISDVLYQVGLTARENHYPHELSGGEKQRLAIARSILNDPVLLIADEPTGNLDPEVADEIHKLFLKINKIGTSVIMATHNYQLIKKYPARIICCKEKKLIESSVEDEIFFHY